MTAKPETTSSRAPHVPPPAAAPADPAAELPLAVTHAEMNAAYDKGEAVPLGASMAWLVRYLDAWWVVYERGWLRVTDTATAEDLDQAATRLAEAEESVSRTPANAARDETIGDAGLPRALLM